MSAPCILLPLAVDCMLLSELLLINSSSTPLHFFALQLAEIPNEAAEIPGEETKKKGKGKGDPKGKGVNTGNWLLGMSVWRCLNPVMAHFFLHVSRVPGTHGPFPSISVPFKLACLSP